MGLNLELGSFLTGGKAMVIRRSIKETEDSSVKDTQPYDPIFRLMVECMVRSIKDLMMTPTEMREAATFACVLVEQTRTRPNHRPAPAQR